ncbi:uncharacterized protein GIQ15_06913 [Arthroderma uncinatum]|uniref:uncharacterized protein n=1 Tax=Arthroderma uncinatum TaxID=74035 RepID=UPI00144AB9AD|nr:uncharacterized protein GIQ15_06913 [Arthroderma uncinatum]KAF3479937.1 hypothetical protein GIQ15_06913 [Arthroderma uncinatum]
MSQRYRHFDVKRLASIAAASVGAETCTGIEKCADGMYNKAFLLTMDNGSQVVAKIPNPNAGLPHLTTASEVATMEFARRVCKTPVPKIYTWSSQDNPVGAEYIIMEKVQGVQLDTVWPSMGISDRFDIVKSIAGYQEAWMSASFDHFGSLYFARDLDGVHHHRVFQSFSSDTDTELPEFAIGPSTGREYCDAGRASIEYDRGPWSTLTEYLTAIGVREMTCVKQLPSLPKSSIALYGPGTYQPTRGRKTRAIECYLAMVKLLCPVDRSIASPCIWHGDLHVENIFVNPEYPTRIVGIIDWQSTQVAPLFYHARQPYILDHNGPQLKGLQRPCLPENLGRLDNDAKREANALYHKQALCALYRNFVHKYNPNLYRALEFQETTSFDLLLLARNLLVDGEATYLSRIAGLEEDWSGLPGVASLEHHNPFPFHFSDAEKADMDRNTSGALLGMQAMQSIQESIGDLFPEQGIVLPDQYEEAKDALRQAKEFIIQTFAKNETERKIWDEEWPFDD